MPATNVETLANPRDSLPNVYTNVTAREIDFVTRGSPPRMRGKVDHAFMQVR